LPIPPKQSTATMMPSFTVLKKDNIMIAIRYAKNKDQGRPATPKELAALFHMPKQFNLTSDDIQFLQKLAFTNDMQQEAFGLIISEAGKEMLANHDNWAGHGTFSTAPRLFSQIYLIGIHTDDEKFVLAACCLLTNKSGDTYKKLFPAIADCEGNVEKVEKFSCNYEKAVHITIEVFSNAVISGCMFHFKRTVLSNLRVINCSLVYNNVANFRKSISYINTLAMVPLKDVVLI